MCTFPRQSFLNFELKRNRVQLRQVESFSWQSKLRKAAYLEGAKNKVGMLSARVIDFQTASAELGVADFWGKGFLASKPQVNSLQATHILAKSLRQSYAKLKGDPKAQQQVTAAAMSVHATPDKQRTMESIATDYLSGEAAAAFTESTPQPTRSAPFNVDQSLLEELINFRRFELNTGVVVLAPFFHVDDSSSGVRLSSTDGKRYLQVVGEVEAEEARKSA
jgi:hypothetical protein